MGFSSGGSRNPPGSRGESAKPLISQCNPPKPLISISAIRPGRIPCLVSLNCKLVLHVSHFCLSALDADYTFVSFLEMRISAIDADK